MFDQKKIQPSLKTTQYSNEQMLFYAPSIGVGPTGEAGPMGPTGPQGMTGPVLPATFLSLQLVESLTCLPNTIIPLPCSLCAEGILYENHQITFSLMGTYLLNYAMVIPFCEFSSPKVEIVFQNNQDLNHPIASSSMTKTDQSINLNGTAIFVVTDPTALYQLKVTASSNSVEIKECSLTIIKIGS